MALPIDTYLVAKLVWETSLAPRHAQCLDSCGLADFAVELNARSHKLASPLVLTVPRTSQPPDKTTYNLVRRLVQSAKGRFIFQLESPPFEWWTYLLELCGRIPPCGVLQVSRPHCARTEMLDNVESHRLCEDHVLDTLCFLNDIITEASGFRSGGQLQVG